ncbi:CDP-glycerol glycerophosphotransferase family protein [Secundilactobacillus paracollinoides]|uniref:Glycosyl transferase n=1 Tax=Secundilactobacillus paracollinoides TaxID=240427 RepID=A0A1B2J1P2_9LACO|nr:CDP-glycerol glycerophosphotransferase family protein [Secundilactobacillus paracollinoides]ANZ62318.1 glycosyl transferase [Secundilactobacillus paracollinoides]ANZ68266.1 glycosyl transferase [Secundilactobacillus paracollinoides]
MRAILSGLHQKKQQQELEFELIDVPGSFDNLRVTFLETTSLASVTLPVTRIIDNNLVRVQIDPAKLQFNAFDQSEFTWQLFLAFDANEEQVILQVESEYLSDRHQLSLTSQFQFNADSEGMATLNIHIRQAEDEFTVNAVNLVDNTLQITGYNKINNQKITDQKIILKSRNSDAKLAYPTKKGTLRGLFRVAIPLTDLPQDSIEDLSISYKMGSQPITQRLILARSLEGQTVQAVLPGNRLVLIEKRFNNGIVIKEFPAPSLGKKIAAVPGKTHAVVDLGRTVQDKVNLRRMRFLFKSGHRPYDQTTIVFESFGGRQVSDSPYAIYRLFKELYPGFNFVWSIDRSLKKFCKENNIPFVVRRTSKWVRTLEKATYWISNARFPSWVKKPNYVTYIQTWHGTPLKKLGLDIENVSMPGTTTAKYHANFVKEANRWDALVSPNDYSTRIFRSAFGFNNQILKVGYPRNDELLNSSADDIQRLKEEMGIPLDKKVVLYAPTYRDNQFAEKGKYTFELPFSLDDFKKQFGEDTVLILRMHYLIANALDISDYTDFVYDFSSHPNISDLYLVSDMLITDYSSVFFDYAYLKRPILFYPYDYHLYKDELRGFYLDYEKDLPGDIANNESELLAGIKKDLQQPDMSHDARFMKFYKRFCAIDDGLSSLKIVNYVVHQIEKNG